MKGNLKIVGTNNGVDRLKDANGEAVLTYKYHKNYVLEFQNETFFLEILDFIVGDDFIEFSAWIGDKDKNFGRIAFQFEPKISRDDNIPSDSL